MKRLLWTINLCSAVMFAGQLVSASIDLMYFAIARNSTERLVGQGCFILAWLCLFVGTLILGLLIEFLTGEDNE